MSNTYLVEKLNNVEWNAIDWRKVERYVFKLQRRIFQASSQGKFQLVRKLQRTLTRSHYARLLATRQVTQDNSGKKTAGIDGVKSISPKQRLKLAANLNLKTKPLPENCQLLHRHCHDVKTSMDGSLDSRRTHDKG